jgi:hypothetical protein
MYRNMIAESHSYKADKADVAEPYGRCVETQPHAGFGFSLIYFYFAYIICLASKDVPTVPANHYSTSYAHLCEPVRPSG